MMKTITRLAGIAFWAALPFLASCHRDNDRKVFDAELAKVTTATPAPTSRQGDNTESSTTPAIRKEQPKKGPRFHDRIKVYNIGNLREVFNDSNHRQLVFANALGIDPIRSLGDAYHTRRPLLHIKSGKNYTVDTLTHSMPFLVPEAAALLDDIGRGFIDSLTARGADGYKIIVTSMLRTPQSVKRLRRVNRNATDSSTHQFGTTFDLSWRRFDCLDTTRTINEADLKNLLAEVLFALRNEGRCLVKFERHTACFHVTATR